MSVSTHTKWSSLQALAIIAPIGGLALLLGTMTSRHARSTGSDVVISGALTTPPDTTSTTDLSDEGTLASTAPTDNGGLAFGPAGDSNLASPIQSQPSEAAEISGAMSESTAVASDNLLASLHKGMLVSLPAGARLNGRVLSAQFECAFHSGDVVPVIGQIRELVGWPHTNDSIPVNMFAGCTSVVSINDQELNLALGLGGVQDGTILSGGNFVVETGGTMSGTIVGAMAPSAGGETFVSSNPQAALISNVPIR